MERLERMESLAKQEADGSWSLYVDRRWLEVHWTGASFMYFHGTHAITRDKAARLLST